MAVRLENGAWLRDCPVCGSSVSHTNKYNAAEADLKGRMCVHCRRKPENNGMFGRSGNLNPFYGRKHTEETKAQLRGASREHAKTDTFKAKMRETWQKHHANRQHLSYYEYWVRRYGEEEALRRLEVHRKKMSKATSGVNNPMYGKPSPQGAGYGWKGWLDGKFFRSLRELRFMLDNPEATSGELAEWTASFTFNGSARTTRPDFILEESKTVVECKPARLIGSPQVEAKRAAMEALVAVKGYKYIVTDPGIVEFDELSPLIDSGRVVLTEKTEELCRKIYS